MLPALLPPPPSPESDVSRRVLDILEFWAKALGALGVIGVFVSRVLKPYNEWRRASLAKMMREILAEELGKIDTVVSREEEIAGKIDEVLTRQDELFHDVDLFLEIAQDNRERHDELNDLLDTMGLDSSRRSDEERRSIDMVFDQLHERRKARRRHMKPPVVRPAE